MAARKHHIKKATLKKFPLLGKQKIIKAIGKGGLTKNEAIELSNAHVKLKDQYNREVKNYLDNSLYDSKIVKHNKKANKMARDMTGEW